MKTITLLLILFSIVSIRIHAQQDNEALQNIKAFAGRNFNYSNPVPEDDVLHLCQTQETLAREQKNYEDLFFIQQIIVNSYSLKGDIGLAVNKAQKMYEEAKVLKSDLGLALSLQAIADTYMNSNQEEQALNTFSEAHQILEETNNNYLIVRLLLQQAHACMLLKNTKAMQNCLTEAYKQLEGADIPDKTIYTFYLKCYQTLYNISVTDEEQARISLEEVKRMKFDQQVANRWYYYVLSRYFDMKNDFKQALLYCDSTQQLVVTSKSLNEYKNIMLYKASLMAKSGDKQEACKVYEQTRLLADSLNMIRYSKQIDSLHISYWVDQMAIENTAIHNRFLGWLILFAAIVLIMATMLIIIARKKNKQLIESRRRLEKARQETADSIQSKSLFLSNMSHELRTPLNAIVGFSDLLTTDEVDDAETKELFGERIKQNADLLIKLFNDVADLSALKGKDINFTCDSYETVSICRNVIDTVNEVKQTAATVHFKTRLDKLIIYTDPGRLQQVLINLLINATKFTKEGSITLTLDLNEELQEAIFSVEDTGCGIPLEKQPHIFERFEKLHEGIQGAGLGLSICQLIVEHVGGRIWIDSKYTEGARFVFTHPLNDQKIQTAL